MGRVSSEAEDAQVHELSTDARTASFFSFADPGGYVWWAGAVLGTLACSCLVAILIIATSAARRTAPVAVLSLLNRSACPALSPLVHAPRPYTGWQPGCPVARAGEPYPCHTYVDCVVLPSSCAPPALLSRMECAPAPAGGGQVCQLSVGPPPGPTAALPVGGFCPSQASRCAWCTDPSRCPSLAGCVPADVCSATNSTGTWQCIDD